MATIEFDHVSRIGTTVLTLGLLTISGAWSAAVSQLVTGGVTDEESAEPLRAALVVLLDHRGNRVATALTGWSGRFDLPASRPDSYRVCQAG